MIVVYLEWLHSNLNLARKKVVADPGCPAGCGKAESSHAVWGCKFLRRFRAHCGAVSGIAGFQHLSFFEFFLLAHSQLMAAAAHPSTAAVQDRAARCWPPPVHGSWKINTDAAVDSTRGLVGVALLRGLWFAVDLGVPSAVVESDAAVVVDCVKAGVVLGSNFGLVLHDIFLVLEQGIFSSVGFAPRECNKAAHALAKLALSLSSDLFLTYESDV
ncbi:hypothetical protein ACOSQ4_014128 [Xanthoceras sorbifolium]